MDANRRAGWSGARWAALILAATAAIAVVAVVILAAFPWEILRTRAEARLSADLGRPVTIGSIERLERFSLRPTVIVHDVRVPQPAWAGPGSLVTIEALRTRFGVLPLLVGRFSADRLEVAGARIDLVRDADGRESWSTGEKDDDDGGPPAIGGLIIVDTVVRYRDARRDRSFTVAVVADRREGLRISGTGLVRGEAVRISASGAAVGETATSQAWPFRVKIEGEAVGLTAVGRMDRPLDVDHFSAEVTGHGRDLKLLDAIIEAGLPATQAVALKARVRHDDREWRIDDLAATIGRSDIAGSAVVVKQGRGSRIEGVVRSKQFDFDDLSSDEGRKRGAAKRLIYGKRLIPDTAIDLRRLARTEGTLDVTIDELLWPGPSPLRTLKAVLVLGGGRLTVKPLTIGLSNGTMHGEVLVDQRKGGPVLTLSLDLEGAQLLDLAPDTGVDGRLAGKLRLTGAGRTVRQAVGRSSGTVTLVARDGQLPARTAVLLGQDVGRGLLTGKDRLATLNCVVMALDVDQGVARTNPLLIDTSRSVTRIEGTIALADERFDLVLRGAPKQASVLRLDVPILIGGTIKTPVINVPPRSKSVGSVLRMLGRAVAGEQGALAAPLDCDALVMARGVTLGGAQAAEIAE
ncbi:hypothetical protein GCM10011529_07390 [Polymorphobacter glacialis]|uniref:AsmA domain-containing protein n=1 Tax=Sandarakinorhabdus glacialis TaxID=1614636 RepID=A0A916ZLJ5_9SPHN|nr:AsmA family protein [Polymorphobacter glacialis]GGE03445.1 hypothetical protein GCM10011529_07390 [Polymorphobacter glacialis]